ncbi:hypothetical protein SAMN02746065_10987 [Desulfocicer vacuolatum DSM 3385]|uniref:Uncharacterized protein n=1 Tax=Desulfocicer vacuolatum DSM 3385 TaxID=1121400 RepID=A0A1W2BRZ3_9BACT|nr:hypothetical protein [Desulfocicer vacuolatum]SMC75750.1 hypothetical protein SAMN02746065_10987 [Desulfocicer vacuolatum DSM 3385]
MGEVIGKILPTVTEFKAFWKKQGPFRYALTSREFPPTLLAPEEWLFSDEIIPLLKALMKWDERKMKIVAAPFSRKKQNVLKPETLTPWKINNFPEEWETAVCDAFTPVGHLTQAVVPESDTVDVKTVEAAFFKCLEGEINDIGYVLLGPEPSLGSPASAFVDDYVKEWESDDLPC